MNEQRRTAIDAMRSKDGHVVIAIRLHSVSTDQIAAHLNVASIAKMDLSQPLDYACTLYYYFIGAMPVTGSLAEDLGEICHLHRP